MQTIIIKCNISAWHLRPCAEIESFCKAHNITGTAYYKEKSADLQSIIQLFLLGVQYGQEAKFEINANADKFIKFMNKLR